MKKSLMNTLARIPELTVSLAIVASLIGLTAVAEVPSGKGLARLLTKPVATTNAGGSREMSCSSCTDRYVQRPDFAARGSNKTQASTVRHGCDQCSTTIASVGVGKAKRDVATHQCSMVSAQALTSCCGTRNPAGMTGCGQK